MSITITIYYTGEKQNAQRFVQEMEDSGIANKIRQEKGNLRYEYFLPFSMSATVLLIDSWKNQQAIDAHHASPMMEEIKKLREKYDLHMKVERYILDENELPTYDKSFIKD